MNVAIQIVTHEHSAGNLLTTAHNILNQTMNNIATIEVPMDSATEISARAAEAQLADLQTDDGVLLLTDLIGSTPFNLAMSIKAKQKNAIVVSGINLSMLLKIFNYRTLALTALAKKAIDGGQGGIAIHE